MWLPRNLCIPRIFVKHNPHATFGTGIFPVKRSTFGERVRQARLDLAAREGHEVSQTDVAGLMGVAQSTVNRWERDSKEPGLDTIARLASVLNVSPAYLAFGIETYPLKVAESKPAFGAPIVGTANEHEKKRKGGK